MKVVKEIFRFILTFGVIFAIFFVLMNFSAFSSVITHYITGAETEEIIKENIGETKVETNPLEDQNAKKLVKKEFPPLYLSVAPLDFRLIVPKIGVNVPMVRMSDQFISDDLWGKFEKEVQGALREGVIHYPGTAYPGQYGNVFITGHSSYYPWDKGEYKDVFSNLNQLEVGDEYYVYYQQKKYRYKVVEKKEVRPYEVKVLEQSKTEKLSTLMTCWPIGTTLRRLVVTGEEV